MRFKCSFSNVGFTLIETVIGILVLAIALTLILPVLIPSQGQSVDQVQQIRASELGQSLLNEILAKSYDENSDRSGGVSRCDEGALACSAVMGPEEGANNRHLFDDVDDYDTGGFTSTILSADNTELSTHYQGFEVDIDVFYDGLALGLANNRLAKRIEITVKTPSAEEITFSSFKANF